MESKEPHDINEELLLRCLEGTASKEEYEKVRQWVTLSPGNREKYRELLDALVASNLLNPVNAGMQQQVWKQLNNEIRNTGKQKRLRSITILKYASAAAAVLVFIFVAGLFVSKQSGTADQLIAQTEKGERRTLVLSDGSMVWLNEETTFEYPDFSDKNIREVTLAGEAYFEIAPDIEKPFVVKTKAMNVEVLGTHFNVKAYDKDVLATATLIEGSVKIRKTDDNKEFILTPGQQLRLNRETKMTDIYHVDGGLYVAWKEGKISFDQESFKEILLFMEQNYQLTICIKDQTLAERKITGQFNLDEEPNKILNVLRQSLNFDFYMKNDTIFINH